MADQRGKLQKIAAGDYTLLSSDTKTLWRIAKYEGLGSGLRGMYAESLWGLWKWPEPIVFGETGIETGESAWPRWEQVQLEFGTRGEAVDHALKLEAAHA